ncbi:DDE-type integrase/transposase/recombinase [Kineococcus xinjiangensis]
MSTRHRILRSSGAGGGERRRQASHPPRTCPELRASVPIQVWSWDITKLRSRRRGVYFDPCVILDICSRHVVGWTLAPTEDSRPAPEMISQAVAVHGVPTTLHADRGASMTGGASHAAGDEARRPVAGRSGGRPVALPPARPQRQPLLRGGVRDPRARLRLPRAVRVSGRCEGVLRGVLRPPPSPAPAPGRAGMDQPTPDSGRPADRPARSRLALLETFRRGRAPRRVPVVHAVAPREHRGEARFQLHPSLRDRQAVHAGAGAASSRGTRTGTCGSPGRWPRRNPCAGSVCLDLRPSAGDGPSGAQGPWTPGPVGGNRRSAGRTGVCWRQSHRGAKPLRSRRETGVLMRSTRARQDSAAAGQCPNPGGRAGRSWVALLPGALGGLAVLTPGSVRIVQSRRAARRPVAR